MPVPYDEEIRVATRMYRPISAHDTRNSLSHPLRHSIINLVRAVGELRASTSRASSTSASTSTPASQTMSPPPQLTPIIDVPTPPLDQVSAALSQPPLSLPPSEAHAESRTVNGGHYLLTSLTLFTTHEPCVMCSMALLHSRVKEVFYLIPMEKIEGCGGLTCVPRLEGVNHRYAVNVWKGGDEEEWMKRWRLKVDDACDA